VNTTRPSERPSRPEKPLHSTKHFISVPTPVVAGGTVVGRLADPGGVVVAEAVLAGRSTARAKAASLMPCSKTAPSCSTWMSQSPTSSDEVAVGVAAEAEERADGGRRYCDFLLARR
ncbi:MAG: hypothetical protein AAFU70_14765, partial [Planctomycetota bacterium]